MILDDELAKLLERLEDRWVVLIVDSCHSGTIARSLDLGVFTRFPNAKPRYLPPMDSAPRSMVVVRDEEPISEDAKVQLTLSAALPHQLAWEADGEGLFTRYLVEGLTDLRADANGNGRITSAELINYIKPRTESWCKQLVACQYMGFTPNLDPKDGAFVLQPFTLSSEVSVVTGDDLGGVTDIFPSLGRWRDRSKCSS